MGWTFGYRNREEAIREEFSGFTLIARARGQRGEWVVAEHGASRFIALALIERGPGGLGVKVVEESQGPVEVDCPLPMLAMAPPGNAYGPGWRQRVHEYWDTVTEPELALGSMVQVLV